MKKVFIIHLILFFIALAMYCQQTNDDVNNNNDSFSLVKLQSALPTLQQSGNTQQLANTYKLMGDYYYSKWYSDSLLIYYKKALQQYELIKDSSNIFFCYMRLGEEAFSEGNSMDESLSWYLPAAGYFERAKEYKLAAHGNYAISTIYKEKSNIYLRRQYLQKAISLNRVAKDTMLDIIMLNHNCYELMKEQKWSNLLGEAKKVVALSSLNKRPVYTKDGLLHIGMALLNLNRTREALTYLNKCIAIKESSRYEVPDAYRLLSICHLRLNNNKEAEKYLALYKHTSDSISAIKQKDNFRELVVQYQTEKKQATIAALQKENMLKEKLSLQQTIYIYILAACLFVLVFAGWMYYRNIQKRHRITELMHEKEEHFNLQLQQEKQKKQLAEFNNQLAEVQLTALSAQMNPHFIFNCMNSIQKYILRNEKNKAMDFLQHFSELMRSVLDNSAKKRLALDEEISMLEKYIFLERERLDNHFDFKIITAPDLQSDFFEIPGMIIQPYVENAIWHGLMNKNDKGFLSLWFQKFNSAIICVVEDNGVGRLKAAELEKHKNPGRKGYGMAIAQKRLELLQQENREVPQIKVEDLFNHANEPSGTRVTIIIQID